MTQFSDQTGSMRGNGELTRSLYGKDGADKRSLNSYDSPSDKNRNERLQQKQADGKDGVVK